jgi:hypothetical protein
VLIKLYREYQDGAFSHWAGCGVPDLAAIVRSGDPGWQLRAMRGRALELLAAQEAATQVGRPAQAAALAQPELRLPLQC